MKLENIFRSAVLNLTPYSSARSEFKNNSESSKAIVKLDANEGLDDGKSPWRSYPDPQPSILLEKLSEFYKVQQSEMLMTRGSDEAIDLLVRSVCEVKDSILINPPTYGMYEVSALIQGANVIAVPLKFEEGTWRLNLAEIYEAAGDQAKNVKIVFVCNPNNPTGHLTTILEIEELCQKLSETLIVVDEAYIEYCASQTAVSLLTKYKNLVILRTMSKAWAMAGIRFGVLIGNTKLISILQKVRAPYPIPSTAISELLVQMSNDGRKRLDARINETVRVRERFFKDLKSLSVVEKVFPSQTNFLLIKFKNQIEIQSILKNAGFIVRDRSQNLGLQSCTRISVGNEIQMSKIISVLQGISK